VYAFVASAGGAVGLLAGGALTQWVTWHWIFFVNVPIGLATMVAAVRLLPAGTGWASGPARTCSARADHLGADARRLHARRPGRRGRLDRTTTLAAARLDRAGGAFLVRQATAPRR
jgi:MFS family permease